MLFGRSGALVVPAWVYGLFLVFLVTPEFWLLSSLSLVLPKRTGMRRFAGRLVLVTVPLVFLVGSGNNVGVRNILLILPWLATLSALGVMGVVERLRSLSSRGARLLFWGLVLALICGRASRVMALHRLPITYCASFTGVDCARVFHIGWGEGMKEAARFVDGYAKANLGADAAPRVFGSGYVPIMRVWTRAVSVRHIESAHLLIDYLPDWQRKGRRAKEIARYVESRRIPPIHEVVLAGRVYVRIYPGPAIRSAIDSTREQVAPAHFSEESSYED
ncbi:MAG: hypothetical protein QM784_33645 [Polyangiaceae bacterium]